VIGGGQSEHSENAVGQGPRKDKGPRVEEFSPKTRRGYLSDSKYKSKAHVCQRKLERAVTRCWIIRIGISIAVSRVESVNRRIAASRASCPRTRAFCASKSYVAVTLRSGVDSAVILIGDAVTLMSILIPRRCNYPAATSFKRQSAQRTAAFRFYSSTEFSLLSNERSFSCKPAPRASVITLIHAFSPFFSHHYVPNARA